MEKGADDGSGTSEGNSGGQESEDAIRETHNAGRKEFLLGSIDRTGRAERAGKNEI